MNKYKEIIDAQNQIIVNKLKEIDVLEDKKSEYYFNWKESKQLQNQKAIECLKEVLEHFIDRPTYLDVARFEYHISDKDKRFIDYINNKIKELEGEE